MRWYNKRLSEDEVTSEPKQYNFLLLEYEHPDPDQEGCFAFERCIKFHLRPKVGFLSKEVFQVFCKLDSVWTQRLVGMDLQRSFACKPCQEEERDGYVPLVEGIKLVKNDAYCKSEAGYDQCHELEIQES